MTADFMTRVPELPPTMMVSSPSVSVSSSMLRVSVASPLVLVGRDGNAGLRRGGVVVRVAQRCRACQGELNRNGKSLCGSPLCSAVTVEVRWRQRFHSRCPELTLSKMSTTSLSQLGLPFSSGGSLAGSLADILVLMVTEGVPRVGVWTSAARGAGDGLTVKVSGPSDRMSWVVWTVNVRGPAAIFEKVRAPDVAV